MENQSFVNNGQYKDAPTTPLPTASASPVTPITAVPSFAGWRTIPSQVERVDKGKIADTLRALRSRYDEISPNEVYLALNPDEVGAAAETQLSKNAHRIE